MRKLRLIEVAAIASALGIAQVILKFSGLSGLLLEVLWIAWFGSLIVFLIVIRPGKKTPDWEL